MGYEVAIAELRNCGEGLVRDAEETADIKLGAALDPLTQAMPGGEATNGAIDLASAWGKRIKELDRGTRRIGERMVEAADRYERDDDAAEKDFRMMGPR